MNTRPSSVEVWKIGRKPGEHKAVAVARLFAERIIAEWLEGENCEVVLDHIKRTNKVISADVSHNASTTKSVPLLSGIMLKFWHDTSTPQTGTFITHDPHRTFHIEFVERDGVKHLYQVKEGSTTFVRFWFSSPD